MAPRLRELPVTPCATCGCRASVELLDAQGALKGVFCKEHGRRAQRELLLADGVGPVRVGDNWRRKRRLPRCAHGFVPGICRVDGCPHQEPPAKSEAVAERRSRNIVARLEGSHFHRRQEEDES
jgi:hypothetical protein